MGCTFVCRRSRRPEPGQQIGAEAAEIPRISTTFVNIIASFLLPCTPVGDGRVFLAVRIEAYAAKLACFALMEVLGARMGAN